MPLITHHSSRITSYDVAIVGGGIVGLATAYQLSQANPRLKILLLEKEAAWAAHQTGRNSGVIHSGLYYKPGSLKARFARDGNQSMVAFCREHGIRHEICGKVVVATEPDELPRLDDLYQRGIANGLDVAQWTPEQLREREPHANGIAALFVPSTGIVRYRDVAETLARLLQEAGAELRLNTTIANIVPKADGVTLETAAGTLGARFVVNCAGLHSDRLAQSALAESGVQIVPFRGEYYTLTDSARSLVRHLIYPVPDPQFPFLGVHFTRMVDGHIHAGPNAVLSLKREGYRKSDINARDLMQTLTFPGFWKLARKHWRQGGREVHRSLSKAAFVRSLQRLIPEITAADIVPCDAGVRAQALHRDGRLVDDFHIVTGPRSLHVVNAPSPAATASLEIGRYLADKIADTIA